MPSNYLLLWQNSTTKKLEIKWNSYTYSFPQFDHFPPTSSKFLQARSPHLCIIIYSPQHLSISTHFVGPVWLRVEVRKWGIEEVVIILFGTWELVSKFFGVWMLLGSVVWKMFCLFRCLDGNVKVEVKKLITKLRKKNRL